MKLYKKNNLEFIDLLKIDIEGGEKELFGFKKLVPSQIGKSQTKQIYLTNKKNTVQNNLY
ncbi:FkbM family methyltransferase [Flavobacterium franklandianum]|uniref:FkbM family methyltransferase n=1 Tax=Flavobacterium franklandianum TaxID=2594430 RepID=A0A553CKC0_9FLAO|nr:FkbM family methyltransferase [Flavobacterium franklandianum]TRX24105.1 FkbM family methyltransferase [Flavobacterium franklandianum]